MKHHTKFLISNLIALALLCRTSIYATAIGAFDSSWGQDEAQALVNLSNSGDIRQPTMALSAAGTVAVGWSNVGQNANRGIFVTFGAGQPITPSIALHLSESQAADAWAPDIAYHSDQLVATWVQGTFPFPGTLMQQDGLTGTPVVVMSPVYGYTTPRLLVGNDRFYLFFTSAESENDWSQADLYYAQRLFTAEDWLTPTVVITRSQTNPPFGGIWYPHAVLNTNKNVVHLVWEQTAGTLATRGIWYTQGVWQAAQQEFAWAALTRLSLANQASVRPKVAVDDAGRVHATWIEQQAIQVSPGIYVTLQYVAYRRYENGQWTPPLEQPAQRLDPQPVQVNAYRPTWSNIAIDARGDTICVAWHGYRGAPGVSGLEDILLKCSHNGGSTWAAQATNASETASLSLFPALRLDTHGAIHLAWEEHQGGDYHLPNYDTYYRQGPFPRTRIYLPLLMRSWRHG